MGGDPQSVSEWEKMIVLFQSIVEQHNSQMRFVILEENGADHGLLRGLGHATYGNMFRRSQNLCCLLCFF